MDLPAFFALGTRAAEEPDKSTEEEAPVLSIESIYEKNEFDAKGYSGRWAEDRSGYYRTIDSAETKAGKDIVWIDPVLGATNIVVTAQDLIPPREGSPLSIDDYEFSKVDLHLTNN